METTPGEGDPADLTSERIASALARLGADAGAPVSVVALTGSTNDDAKRAATSGAPHGAAFFADAQTAGRGRGSHTWHSPPGENLYMSIVLRPSVAPTEVAPITLAVGLAVARVVRRAVDPSRDETIGAALRGGRVTLKWPNDVYVDGRKIAGVLVEGQLRGDRVTSLVAGIGLNVRTASFPGDLARTATSLAIAGTGERDRSEIAAALIAELLGVVRAYETSRLEAILEEIRALDYLRDRHVEVNGIRGVACGIDDSGCLLVRTPSGELRPIGSGEVTIRA